MLRRVSTKMTLRKNPVASVGMRYCLAINVPFIAESISEGKVMTWGKKIGDAVEEDDPARLDRVGELLLRDRVPP
jgi:hypothetical protein